MRIAGRWRITEAELWDLRRPEGQGDLGRAGPRRGQDGPLIVCDAMRLVDRGLRWASDRTSCSSMSITLVSGS
jgi:hypothetical protein